MTVPGGNVEQRNLDTAATEFQRRFHISADDEGRHRSSVINQVSLARFSFFIPVYKKQILNIYIYISNKRQSNIEKSFLEIY